MDTQPPSTGFGIAGLQLAYAPGDNLERISAEIASLARRFPWVRMVLLGELCSYGANTDFAQVMPGDAETFLCGLARRHGLWLVPGSLYERDDDKLYNTTPVIAPDGTVVARYRKLFPFAPYERDVSPGNEFVTFSVPGAGCFGVFDEFWNQFFDVLGGILFALGNGFTQGFKIDSLI